MGHIAIGNANSIIIFKFYINDFSCSKEAVKERTNI